MAALTTCHACVQERERERERFIVEFAALHLLFPLRFCPLCPLQAEAGPQGSNWSPRWIDGVTLFGAEGAHRHTGLRLS